MENEHTMKTKSAINVLKSNWFQSLERFEDMELDERLLENVLYDFQKPFIVQQKVIRPCIDGHDIIIEAPKGSGKTTAIAISILQQIDSCINECQALILVPTVEIGKQTQAAISMFADNLPNFFCYSCDSERSYEEERRYYEMGIQILIGTPQSIMRLFTQDSFVRIDKIQLAVLENANELFTNSNKHLIYQLFEMHLLWCSQIVITTTMFSNELNKFKEDFMSETVQVILKKDELFSLKGVKQFSLFFQNEESKLESLYTLCNTLSNIRMIIFCNTRRNVDELHKQMNERGCSTVSVYVKPESRMKIFENFELGLWNILITTDYLNIGYKLPISLIINYDLPTIPVAYSDRLGLGFDCDQIRVAINFVSENNRDCMNKIEHFYNSTIVEIPKDYTFVQNLLETGFARKEKSHFISTHLKMNTPMEISVEEKTNNDFDSIHHQKISKNNETELSEKILLSQSKSSSKDHKIVRKKLIDRTLIEAEQIDVENCGKTLKNSTNSIDKLKYDQPLPKCHAIWSEFDDFKNDLTAFRDQVTLLGTKHSYFFSSENVKIMKDFDEVNFQPALSQGVHYDYKKPLVVQQRALISCIEGYNVVIEAPEKSGKTTTIIIAALQIMNDQLNECQAIILVPSLEKVEQVEKLIKVLSHDMSMRYLAFSGADVCNKLDAHIIITTLGHIHEVIKFNNINLNSVKMLAFDEADKIMYNSFHNQIQDIFLSLSNEVQLILSATVPLDGSFIQPFSRDFLKIIVRKDDIALHDVKQFYTLTEGTELKVTATKQIYEVIKNYFPIVVFCNTYRELNALYTQMINLRLPASVLKSDMSEEKFRNFADQFREERKRILISLDLFASSINFEYVPYIINYSLPIRPENYVRRVRRSEKFKRKPKVINILVEEDKRILNKLKQFFNMDIVQIFYPFTENSFLR